MVHSTDWKEKKPCLEISRASLSAAALASVGQDRTNVTTRQPSYEAYQELWGRIEENQRVEEMEMYPLLEGVGEESQKI
jgi:hypothetical protein